MVSFEQAPAKWSFWARCNCISDKALTEDSETGVSVSKLGDRAVQDTEVQCSGGFFHNKAILFNSQIELSRTTNS